MRLIDVFLLYNNGALQHRRMRTLVFTRGFVDNKNNIFHQQTYPLNGRLCTSFLKGNRIKKRKYDDQMYIILDLCSGDIEAYKKLTLELAVNPN